MAFQKITENVENVSTLSDTPALTPGELKKVFDKGNKAIKYYFNNLIDELNNNMYPVGTGFISYDDTDYSNHLGFKWDRVLLGKTPVGKNEEEEFNTIGKTGGEIKHKLTRSELPAERLKVLDGKYLPDAEIQVGSYADGGSNYPGLRLNSSEGAGKLITENLGSGQAHNNLQPYEVVNFWKRLS